MEGVISNFRIGRHTKSGNHMIIIASAESKKTALKFVGKKVIWTSPAGKQIAGKIVSAHGSKGALRAIFEKGMPGQSIGQKVKIE